MPFNKYVIADLKVLMKCSEDHMIKQGADYLENFDGEPDIVIEFSDEFLQSQHEKYPQLTYDETEYVWTGSYFYHKLISFDGFMLHSSSIVVDGKAYLFSAPSGTGKSTHTSLWRKYLGDDNVKILNDDKPAIRLVDGKLYAYGTPWSGKTDQNINMKIPLGGIVILSRSDENYIKPAPTAEAVKQIYWQTVRPRKEDLMIQLLDLYEKLLINVPVFEMGCNMNEDAVRVSYEALLKKPYKPYKLNGVK